ncbi:serine hydrolase [Streptomyces sp. NPDC046876]|uniref:D-alanyl-D-alanine carboxypeptidase family protein n=1 Tax=Streptomyces sp. NPDC046876 TaxID=3155616 RepID=UPI0033C73BEC
MPARSAAKPESDSEDDTAHGGTGTGASGDQSRSGTRSTPDAEAGAGDDEDDEVADGTLTLGKPARDKVKAATEPTARADAAASGADSDGGGEDTRTVGFRAPDAAVTGRKPKAEVAAAGSGDGSADADSDGAEARGDRPDTDTDTEAEDGGRKVPAWARGEEGDSERTSKFVALKPLDVPAPPAPRPQPRPEAPEPTTPKAPLDLLAELTNTPPPPETPRRTVLRRVKVWTPILLLLAGGSVGAQLLRPLPAPRLVAAEAAHSVDGQFSIPWPAKGQGAVRVPGSGEVGTFGEQKPVPTASVAKVMTAYVILKGHPLRNNEPGPDITVDAKAVAEGNSENESRIQGLTAGSKFSQQDMLKMLMIPSGNNIGRLLARWDTGSDSEAAFVEKMNAAARELGMKDTTYTDPSGLDAGTVSTATDQLKLAEAVMKNEVFRAIVAMPSAPIKGLAEPLINNNELLSVQGLSVYGIKTGSSTPAGGTLMWAARKSVGDETPLILGTLMEQRVEGPDPNAKKSLALVLANSRKIIEALRTALASTPLVRKGDTVGYVDDGLGGRTPLVATKDLNVIGVPGQQFKLTLGAGTSQLPHQAKAGTEVGTLTAGEGEGAKSVPVAVRTALPEPSVRARLTRLG